MTELRWHQALVFALTGRRQPSLGSQPQPDLDQLLADLGAQQTGHDLRAAARDLARARREHQLGWPMPVPDDLRQGLGAAQLSAALAELISRLDLDAASRPVLSARSPDAAEQRLLRDVPPHHGS